MSLFQGGCLASRSSGLRSCESVLGVQLYTTSPSYYYGYLIGDEVGPTILYSLAGGPIYVDEFRFHGLAMLRGVLCGKVLQYGLFRGVYHYKVAYLYFLSALGTGLFGRSRSRLFQEVSVGLFPYLLPSLLLRFSGACA